MNSRLTFIIPGSFYFLVLLVSYLLRLFYPFLALYCMLLIPLVASFFLGYTVEEVDIAIKIFFACFFLHASAVIGLLNVSFIHTAFYDIFLWETRSTYFWGRGDFFLPWIMVQICVYYLLIIPTGIAALCAGGIVTDMHALIDEWYKLTAAISGIILVLSLLYPTQEIENKYVTCIAVGVFLYSVVEWSQYESRSALQDRGFCLLSWKWRGKFWSIWDVILKIIAVFLIILPLLKLFFNVEIIPFPK